MFESDLLFETMQAVIYNALINEIKVNVKLKKKKSKPLNTYLLCAMVFNRAAPKLIFLGVLLELSAPPLVGVPS